MLHSAPDVTVQTPASPEGKMITERVSTLT